MKNAMKKLSAVLKKLSAVLKKLSAVLKKLSAVLKKIFGWGILVSLLAGGLTFLGYVAALIVGGEAAGRICEFIYKDFMPVIIYATSCLVLLGLLAMYLNGEMALTGKKGK